eukprot:TRINITY_DN1276_c0_g1_i1.p1 TRINITY_DN1276_c0_g1~~TRINITY_DN1276_c0_g1_i1.p1  ORF type:complete len:200 (+),score=34.65 TRINITY_DN1276_c0_g1_i1:89-688(+)
MFGLVIQNRLVKTDFEQVDETHFIIELENASTITNLCVILTGDIEFPENTGGLIMIQWPPFDLDEWHYLGVITNDKPSSFFRLKGVITLKNGNTIEIGNSNSENEISARIGISIEPIDNIYNSDKTEFDLDINQALANTINENDVRKIALNVLTNLQNYASSFIQDTDYGPIIPGNVFDKWCTNLNTKITKDPTFLIKE